MEIVVAGAGIGGLAFAAALRRKAPGAHVTLYERDDSSFSRAQGYALGITGDLGVPALRRLGLDREALAGDTVTVSDFVFTDQQGRALLELRRPLGDERYVTHRVQREQLKTVLLDALGDVDIHYGQRCTGYETDGERVTASFASGARVEGDYLVGADGVASGVRARMVGDAPKFLGLSAIYGDAPFQPDHPLLRGGYFITLGRSGASLFCYTQPGESVHWSCTLHTVAPSQLDGVGQDDLLARVEHETVGWFELVRRVVGATDLDSVGVRDYYDRDPVSSIRSGRVWLVGDAAHPMSPFQGRGANCALANGVRLADLFAGDGAEPPGAEPLARRIEAELVERSSRFVVESRKRAEQLHATSRYAQAIRNVGLRVANTFMSLASRRADR